MKKVDLLIFRKYLIEFITYLCEKDKTWNIEEVLVTLRVVQEELEEKYDTKD